MYLDSVAAVATTSSLAPCPETHSSAAPCPTKRRPVKGDAKQWRTCQAKRRPVKGDDAAACSERVGFDVRQGIQRRPPVEHRAVEAVDEQDGRAALQS